jgi:hypothetical protein
VPTTAAITVDMIAQTWAFGEIKGSPAGSN